MADKISFGAVGILALIAIVGIAAVVGPPIASQNEGKSTNTFNVTYSENTTMVVDDIYQFQNDSGSIEYNNRFEFGGTISHSLTVEDNGNTTSQAIQENETRQYDTGGEVYTITATAYNETGNNELELSIEYTKEETEPINRDGANRLWEVALLLMVLLVVAIFVAIIS